MAVNNVRNDGPHRDGPHRRFALDVPDKRSQRPPPQAQSHVNGRADLRPAPVRPYTRLGGNHPTGVPVFAVTHPDPETWVHPDAPFTFVTDGIESAVQRARVVAGYRDVAIASATIAQRCLNASLLDEIVVELVPVLLGRGIRFFDNLTAGPVRLDEPDIVEGTGVTHLLYRTGRG